ncbi:hypothetical protein GCM10027586_10050 [Kineococcus gypseus]|uniref:PIN domain-containing protein n=1 Tax=Kineococcus gypseus TaxID=1637102 RepID=UPI003D7D978E
MTEYLLDTDAVLTLFSPPPGAAVRIPLDEPSYVSTLTETELRFGFQLVAGDPVRSTQRLNQLTRLLSTWSPLPVDGTVQQAYTLVARAALDAGQQPRRRQLDLLIAATALAHGMTLVTDDRRLATAVSSVVPVARLL